MLRLIYSFCFWASSRGQADDGVTDLTQTETFGTFFSNILKADFMPHGHCFFWRSDIVWLHVVSDALIVLSYYSIPLMLLYFRKKRTDLPYPWMFALFAAFIFWCGTTHLMNIITLWTPVYRAEGILKLITAAVSCLTAVLLFPLIPQALTLRSAKELEAEKVKRRELEKFTHIASHDLREPLRTISLFGDILSKSAGDKLDNDSKEYLSHITSASQRMSTLIEDLVAYSQLDSKELRPEPTTLEDCLKKATDNLSVLIEESRARINFSAPEDTAITAIPSQVIQLFQNLLANAIKFADKKEPVIKISAIPDGAYWQVSVKDNGIGFDPKYKEQIFLVFKRLHTNQSKYSGTGIGLAICKKIIEQHRGSIWAESSPGNGATFLFTIPKAEMKA